ncbi:MAG: ATP-binding cassette domain-containing protein [Bacillota bacterium]
MVGVNLQVLDLTVNYGAYTALDAVTFSVEKGSCVALIGPNGAGKSSLLRTVSRLLKPSRGLLYLDGRDLQKIPLREISRSVAVVPQDTAIDFDFSVEEVVAMGRYPHLQRFQKEGRKDREIIAEAMQITGITHLASRSVVNLSGGERQRVIIARALAQEPEILLLDEPTANLDINYQVEFLELARTLNRERGVTIIAAIHDLNLAAQFFDCFILLNDRKILSLGRPEEVLTPQNIRIAYGMEAVVQRNPLHGKLHITVIKGNGTHPEGPARPGIHVIGGGEETVPLLDALLEAGYRPSVGPLTREDSGHRFAVYHALRVITLPPFSPVSDSFHRQHLELIKEAQVVVVPSIPFGMGNLRNLEAVQEAMSPGMSVLLFEETPVAQRDYCGGKAQLLYESIKNRGALVFRELKDLLSFLREQANPASPGPVYIRKALLSHKASHNLISGGNCNAG